MLKPSINEVLDKIDNRYYLVESKRDNRWS